MTFKAVLKFYEQVFCSKMNLSGICQILVKGSTERFTVWYLAQVCSPDFTQLPPGHVAFSLAFSTPQEHTAWLPFWRPETIQTHKPSLSYQVPTYPWAERVHVRVKCIAQEHSSTAQLNSVGESNLRSLTCKSRTLSLSHGAPP